MAKNLLNQVTYLRIVKCFC